MAITLPGDRPARMGARTQNAPGTGADIARRRQYGGRCPADKEGIAVRRILAALLAATLAGCTADRVEPAAGPSGAAPSAAPSARAASPPPPAQLPQGGTRIFPAYRVVAYYGTAGNSVLGVLGEDSPDRMLRKLRSAAKPFGGGRKVQVAYELIASVAQAGPGADGDYSRMIPFSRIQQYVDHARRNKALVVLDLQPGRGDFLPQARRLERFLVQPHVGLALDPEWRMPAGKVPGRTIGRVGAAEVNRVSAYLSGLVGAHRLPEKLFVVHQFRASMLPDIAAISKRPGLALVQHVDGFGTRAEKDATWDRLRRPGQFHLGYKLFYDEDVKRYGAAEVLRFRPVPELVSFQ
ncbi:hypothetical protein GCM10020358_33030 [Amorphoplanes nipponensis]|uniref:Lipoprotein n=1 Tax=Actinoplanes nipponensis TaxID=135950 RepID=A0A919JLH2_9ACTN|nr:hypothetical protein [Actinoplanes nipponensis]GIE51346.1 hypothetical protein Ani05nite_48800 [Actinoplanes nipponensis]